MRYPKRTTFETKDSIGHIAHQDDYAVYIIWYSKKSGGLTHGDRYRHNDYPDALRYTWSDIDSYMNIGTLQVHSPMEVKLDDELFEI